jgi:hypothetical protein
MAKATTTKRRRRTAPRIVANEERVMESVGTDILRRLQAEIIRNPIRWALISLGIGYIYGRFKR